MWGGSADRIEKLIANHKVDVCTIGPERIVTGQSKIWTGLPPTVSLYKRLGNRSEQSFTDNHTAVPLRQKLQNFMPSIRMVPAIMTPRY
jgi:hypothetical protein